MKPIEELNISPWPWHLFGEYMVCYKNGMCVCDDEGDFHTVSDARLVAAAPEMYECLLEAVEDKCCKCKAEWYGECVTADGKDCEMVARWKSVLAKAAGEEMS